MIILRPPQAEDAASLFPLVYQTGVADTLQWDGPTSWDEYRQGIASRAERVRRGETHLFTILEPASGQPVGMADIRPYEEPHRADIGLWIGKPFQGKSYGTQVIHCLIEYGFAGLGLEKIEASVFVGNQASRRIFEKNGFLLEGTIRKAVYKREQYLDEWLFGITRGEYYSAVSWIVHLCSQQSWLEAQSSGEYRARSLDKEGFIHASRPDQIVDVANTFYRDMPDLVLLWIDPAQVQARLLWEAVGEQVFPHLYGPLNLEAVHTVTKIKPRADGYFNEQPLPIDL